MAFKIEMCFVTFECLYCAHIEGNSGRDFDTGDLIAIMTIKLKRVL